MKTILLLKEIYIQGFENLGSFLAKWYLKILTWFGFAMFAMVLYAFFFRLATGFAFD